MRSSVHGHGHRIASLHEDSSRTGELAYKAFTSGQVTDDTARRNTLKRVVAVPRDQVAVVDDILLAFTELKRSFVLAIVL